MAEPTATAALARSYAAGMSAFGARPPMALPQWAAKNFYLSTESSYVEGQWEAWPFQRAIMACVGNDEVRAVDVKKSARIGYTKIVLAGITYFAEHKRRNQALWQPTDDDRDEFVKTELDPVLRDMTAMHAVFPALGSRHKDNTLLQKKFRGSMLHLRGGKAAKNYRRISVDTVWLDELSAFDRNVEKEGAPDKLAAKRIEGATFPKMVCGSTPKIKGACLIDIRFQQAQVRYRYQIRCPHCDRMHALTWGGKDADHGLKWLDRDPRSVRHMCPHDGCHVLITQSEYLDAAAEGVWVGDDGSTIDHDGVFRDADSREIDPPEHIAFHVWTGYSPAVPWHQLVKEFFDAHDAMQVGDDTLMQTFWNTTLGECWEGEIERTAAEDLMSAAQEFPLKAVPEACLLLLAGLDVQGNRIEIGVWGYGRGCEMWTIDHKVIDGNPAEQSTWDEVAEYLFNTTFPHPSGTEMRIYASAIDTGGHHTHATYEFARAHKRRRVFAVKGRPSGEKAIQDGATLVDIDWKGKRSKKGVRLWYVGTNHAKDLLFGRLGLEVPGPGYIHFSKQLPEGWFRQFTAEARTLVRTPRGTVSRWIASSKRVETWDCAVYATWLEEHYELSRRTSDWWDQLALKVGVSGSAASAAPVRAPRTRVAPESPASAAQAPLPPARTTAAPRRRVVARSNYLNRR